MRESTATLTGSLSRLEVPWHRIMPSKTLSKRKQLASGFGKPFSRCNDRIAAR